MGTNSKKLYDKKILLIFVLIVVVLVVEYINKLNVKTINDT